MNHWIEVFRSDNTQEAQLKARLLEQYGLHPTLDGENLASLVGMGGHGLPCRVLVRAEEVAQAQQLLIKLEEDKPQALTDEPTHCPNCNADWEPGFIICWRCETQQP